VRNFLKTFTILFIFLLLNISNSFATEKIKIQNLRTQEYQDYIRFVIDTTQKPVYKTLELHDPERVVIDIDNTDYLVNKSDFEAGQLIDSIRTGKFENGARIVLDINVDAKVRKHFVLAPSESKKNWRLVVDIDKKGLPIIKNEEDLIGELIAKQEIESTKTKVFNKNNTNEKIDLDDLIGSLIEEKSDAKIVKRADSIRRKISLNDSSVAQPLLKPNSEVVKKQQIQMKKLEDISIVLKNNRNLSIDNIISENINIQTEAEIETEIKTEVAEINVSRKQKVSNNKYANNLKNRKQSNIVTRRKYNIVIDAGHGGKDPGTIGRKKTQEKNITLQYAKILRDALKKTGRYNVYLTRKGDYFISLNGRVKKARQFNADLFISIHADSSPNKKARGFSIYTLSQKASDTRTARLAKKENKADILGGLNLYGEYQDTINVLVDLSRREAMNSSSKFAEIMVKEMNKNKVKTLGTGHKYGNFAVLLAPDTASALIEIGFLSNRAEERILKTLVFKQKFAKGVVESIDGYFR